MTREELLSLLEKMIPSFHRKWNEYGGNICDEKYGFLYNDETFYGPLMEVDENDNVIFGKTFNNHFTTKEQNQLNKL